MELVCCCDELIPESELQNRSILLKGGLTKEETMSEINEWQAEGSWEKEKEQTNEWEDEWMRRGDCQNIQKKCTMFEALKLQHVSVSASLQFLIQYWEMKRLI